MAEAFIIMQIGNRELDEVCERSIAPALKACGLDAKRVDKHNQGGMLKSEIISFIERSQIIIADLTNERPNCYLEIGYAMGVDKFRNLILTAKEDHHHESPNYKNGGPKIHFDLSGYDILFWNAGKLDEFRRELEKRIRRRLAILAPPAPQQPVTPWDNEWIGIHRDIATPKLRATGKSAFMEVRFSLNYPKPTKTQQELDEAARESTISTFGWPIGVYLGNRDEFRPRPRADGIVAEIDVRGTYDYWTIRRNGDFYLLKTIFEDERDQTKIFFDTRIVRITEVLLYCARLYGRLGLDLTSVVNVAIKHGGLRGRVIAAANSNRLIRPYSPSIENEIESEISVSLGGLEHELVSLVKEFTSPLFALFDYFSVADRTLEEIVNSFVEGRIN